MKSKRFLAILLSAMLLLGALAPLGAMTASAADTYTVTYDLNDVTITTITTPSAQTKIYDVDLTLARVSPDSYSYLDGFYPKAKVFLGWATTQTATVPQYKSGDIYSDNADITLYAVWRMGTYRITLDFNDGENEPKVIDTSPFMTDVVGLPSATRDGYIFNGWFPDPTSTWGLMPGSKFGVHDDVTLYAIWGNYIVTLDVNPPNGFFSLLVGYPDGLSITPPYAYYGNTATQSKHAKTRDVDLPLGIDKISVEAIRWFLGWADSPTATEVQYRLGDVYSDNADITLYALWGYNVTYDANGGAGTPAAQIALLDASAITNVASLTLTTQQPTWEGYTFKGWADSSASSVPQYQPGATLSNISTDITLYAVWEELPPHVHSHTAVTTPPTCAAQGFTTYTCACEDSYVDDYVNALGHDWGAWVVTAPATEDAEGVETRVCGRNGCGASETRPVGKLDHAHNFVGVTTPPTCTAQGFTTYTCAKDGDSYVGDYVNALGHDWGAWVVTTPATEDEEGVETHVCGRNGCNASETRPVGKLPQQPKTFTDSATGVSLYAPVGTLPQGVTGLSVTATAINVQIRNFVPVQGWNITLLPAGTQPTGYVTVYVPIPSSQIANGVPNPGLAVYYCPPNSATPEQLSATPVQINGAWYMQFQTDHFSVYALMAPDTSAPTPPSPPQPTPKKYIFSTKYEATFVNWILFFLCFGFIWMWF